MRIRQVSSMSPYNSTWDPSSLRLNQDGVKRMQGGARRGRRVSPVRGKFIAGPIDVSWVIQASRLGVKALLVGLALWHLKKLRQADTFRSEEHTSELQSLRHLVCRLLLE